MPPKRKSAKDEDHRSPQEIAVANMAEQIRLCDLQVTQFRDGVHDLAVHGVKIKQLEAELVPREAELKTVVAAYHKLSENCVSLNRRSREEEAAAARPGSRGSIATPASGAVRPGSRGGLGTPASGSRPASRGSLTTPAASERPAAASRPVSRGSAAAMAAAAPAAPLPSMVVEDTGDRDALRALAATVRDNIGHVMGPLFFQEQTVLEKQMEEQKARQAEEAAAAAAAAAAAVAAGKEPTAAVPVAAPVRKGKPASADPANRPLNAVDHQLYAPPGIDMHFAHDAMKLRLQRLHIEKQMKACQAALAASRQLVARRNSEGASKTALKKAEKTLVSLRAALVDLERQKLDFDMRKRSEATASASAKTKKK
jgi:hypothetical protein